MTTSIAQHMKLRRRTLGLSQPRVAERARVHERTVRQWELGKATPSVIDFIEWARAIELDAEQLAEVLGWGRAPK